MFYLFLHTFENKGKKITKFYNLDVLRQHIQVHLGAAIARFPEIAFYQPAPATPTSDYAYARLRYQLPDGRLGNICITVREEAPIARRAAQHKLTGILTDLARQAMRSRKGPVRASAGLTLDYGEA